MQFYMDEYCDFYCVVARLRPGSHRELVQRNGDLGHSALPKRNQKEVVFFG